VQTQRNDTELAVFVTPIVVSADDPDVQQRGRQGQALVHASFREPVRLNTPTRAKRPPPQPVSGSLPSRHPWTGSGGQWKSGVQEGRTVDAGAHALHVE